MNEALSGSISLSIPEKAARRGSVALSESGAAYAAGCVGSQTHLLDIPSELAALVRATHNNDVRIIEMRTVVADGEPVFSPIVAKILIDHVARTNVPMRYIVTDFSGATLLEVANVIELLPAYTSPGIVLTTLTTREPETSKAMLDSESTLSEEMQLRAKAMEGMVRNVPTRDGASGYGAAVLTSDGTIYFGGQYSTFEHRLGVHAEMGVLLNALMDGARDMVAIGIASSKFPDSPCSPCGCCRQYIAELARTFTFEPDIHLFATETEQYQSYTIQQLLPVQWTNTK